MSDQASPDGRWLAVGFSGSTNKLSAWDLNAEINTETEIKLSDKGAPQLEFSPCGRYLCGAGGNRLVLFGMSQNLMSIRTIDEKYQHWQKVGVKSAKMPKIDESTKSIPAGYVKRTGIRLPRR